MADDLSPEQTEKLLQFQVFIAEYDIKVIVISIQQHCNLVATYRITEYNCIVAHFVQTKSPCSNVYITPE